MDQDAQTRVEAAVLRKLLQHLQYRTDVQNIDLMGMSGFCRNCLADWWREAAEQEGTALSKDEAREAVYGMAYQDFKERYQAPATEEQMARMKEGVKKNEGRGF